MKLIPLANLSERAVALLAIAKTRAASLRAGMTRTIADKIYAVNYSAERVLLFKHATYMEGRFPDGYAYLKFSYVKYVGGSGNVYASYDPLTGLLDGRFSQDLDAYAGDYKTVYADGTVLGYNGAGGGYGSTYVSVNRMQFPDLCALGYDIHHTTLVSTFEVVGAYVGSTSALLNTNGLENLFPYQYSTIYGSTFLSDRVLSAGEIVAIVGLSSYMGYAIALGPSAVTYQAAQSKLLSDEAIAEFAALGWPSITGDVLSTIFVPGGIPDGAVMYLYVLWFWLDGLEHGCVVLNPAEGLKMFDGGIGGIWKVSSEFAIKGKVTLTYSSGAFAVTAWTPSAAPLKRFEWKRVWQLRCFVASYPDASGLQLEAYYSNIDGETTTFGPYHTEDECLTAIKRAIAIVGI